MGIFNAAYQWRSAVAYLPGILVSLGLPILASLKGAQDHRRYRKVFLFNVVVVFGLTGLAALPIGVASPYIMASYGQGFVGAWPVLTRLLLVAVLLSGHGALLQYLSSNDRMWQTFALSICWATSLLSLAWMWRADGAEGLANAHLVSAVIAVSLTAVTCRHGFKRTPAAGDPSHCDGAHVDADADKYSNRRSGIGRSHAYRIRV